MLVTLDPVYFVTLPLLCPAETDVLITARNTCTESLVGQVVKAARLQIHLRRAKKMWGEELSMFKALDRQGNEHISNFAQPLYLQVPLPEAQLILALLRSAEAWGSIEALRALVAAMDARWDAIITAALAVPAVALA